MRGWLIYHPRRVSRVIDGHRIHFDSTEHNQDPYTWNDRFLHSYCHITQMAPDVEDIEFWTTGDSFPNFTALYCDLVLVVEEKSYWLDANYISPGDPIVDSEAAYRDHYSWAQDHPFHRRKRFTLKANRSQSFQPQDADGELVDIVPGLVHIGLHRKWSREASSPATPPSRCNWARSTPPVSTTGSNGNLRSS